MAKIYCNIFVCLSNKISNTDLSFFRVPTEQENLHPRSTRQLNVIRRVYKQSALNLEADYHTPTIGWAFCFKKFLRKCGFHDCLKNAIPIANWLPKYNIKEYLVGDFSAGATTAVLHIPQGLAYSLLAYSSPMVGLYMAFFPILIYIIFGTSPHVCLGSFAVVMLMVGTVVLEHGNFPDTHVTPFTPEEVVSALTFAVGIILMIMWILRLGALSSLLCEPLVSGLTTGAAFHVCASQVKELFGVKLPSLPRHFKVIRTVIEVFKRLSQTNWAAFTLAFISCFCLAVHNDHIKPWMSKRTRIPIPVELMLIVLTTITSKYMDLHKQFDIRIIGHIPTGLPRPRFPRVELLGAVYLDAITLTMVTYTLTMSMGLIFATKDKYEIDANQELLALGASNLFGSFFMCAPICASLSRSFLQYSVGCKTLITAFISSLFIMLVLLWFGPFFEPLPLSVLAAIVIVSLKRIFTQSYDFVRFCKLSKLDATVWMVTFLVTALINVDIGLAAGMLASIATLFYRSQTAYSCLLGRVKDTDLYLDIKRYRRAKEIPGIKIFHYCGSLNFASRNTFRSKLFCKTGYMHQKNPRARSYVLDQTFSQRVGCIIIDASALSYIDAPGIKVLVYVNRILTMSNIVVLLAGANGPVQEMIENYNAAKKHDRTRLSLTKFPSIHDAVTFYRLSLLNEQKAQLNDITVNTENLK